MRSQPSGSYISVAVGDKWCGSARKSANALDAARLPTHRAVASMWRESRSISYLPFARWTASRKLPGLHPEHTLYWIGIKNAERLEAIGRWNRI